MQLFREHGYDRTTIAEIAARAGLTERTFFRHFADKREVLFGGTDELERFIEGEVAAAAEKHGPFDATVAALEKAAAALQAIRPLSEIRARRRLIEASAELRERELMKLTSIGKAIREGLTKRGVAEPAANLAAEAGMLLFKVGFERWLADPKTDYANHLRTAARELRVLTKKA